MQTGNHDVGRMLRGREGEIYEEAGHIRRSVIISLAQGSATIRTLGAAGEVRETRVQSGGGPDPSKALFESMFESIDEGPQGRGS